MLTKEQINNADGDKRTLDSYRSDYNMFGQMALENVLDNTVADAVLSDLFARAHTKGKEGITVNPVFSS